jgi:hypothetical protein
MKAIILTIIVPNTQLDTISKVLLCFLLSSKSLGVLMNITKEIINQVITAIIGEKIIISYIFLPLLL